MTTKKQLDCYDMLQCLVSSGCHAACNDMLQCLVSSGCHAACNDMLQCLVSSGCHACNDNEGAYICRTFEDC